jgi:hypothetical protein
MPSSLPALPQFKINGPFWSADADLLRFSTPTRAWDMRELFVDLATRDYTRDKVLLPGTLVVLCWVRTVRITPTAAATPVYTFTRSTGEAPPPETLNLADIKRLVLEGAISLLLVQADPNQWKGDEPARLGTVTCLAGHIALDVLRGETTSRPAFFRALDLIEAPLGVRPGATAIPGALSVHATGATLYGQARLPWETARIAAPYQLARIVPDPIPILGGPPQPSYRLTVETERLTAGEQTALGAAWGRLATSIDPGNPAIAAEEPFVPRWVTLEVANPKGIPRMYWLASPWQALPASLPLHIEREELNLVLSDQALFDQVRPATSLARTVLDDVLITRSAATATQPAQVSLTIQARRQGALGTLQGQLSYDASIEGGSWREQFSLSGHEVAYQPVETPRQVLDALDLPAPSWAAGSAATPLEKPVLWAFMPLEDGWAQVPIPNLTEQMYLDAQLAQAPASTVALLSGAVAYGNDKPGALEAFAGEQPWTLTLLDADSLSGTWTLTQQTGSQPLMLTGITLQLLGPEVAINGLLWLATSKPTPQDALPTLDDWVAGLRPISLRTVDPTVDVLPPLAKVSLAQLGFELREAGTSHPSARMGPWSLELGVDADLLRSMVDKQLLPEDTFSRYLPLVWRRHQTLPMVQALPLTQSSTPPSYPSASRQLVPFELPVAADPTNGLPVPSGWQFGRAAGNGAAAWPRVQGTVAPAREWAALADLPAAALSLPGLVLDPRAAGRTGLPADASTGLPQQFRHDLPYADEVHALAQLPKIPRKPGEVSIALPATRPEPPRPLSRDTLEEHFQRLSERASLAAADAVEATTTAGGRTQIHSLVEPLAWPVSATLATQSYPGSLTLANSAGAPAASTTLEAEGALKSLTGAFVEETGGLMHLSPTPAAGAYELVAGSMAAHAVGDGTFRDQRGLMRGATASGPRVLRTPVRLAEQAESFELASLLDAVPLRVGPGVAAGSEVRWRLWFRDLPTSAGAFSRARTRSSLAEDVNDPEAGSRGLNHLNSWEWRLEPEVSGRYVLFGLDFFPLTLEAATLVGEELHHVELVGRLQLPVQGEGEVDALANAVRLTFDRDAGSGVLALSAVAAESPLGEWPLALSSGESGDAPRIEWSQLALASSREALEMDGASLVFQLFGADWRIPLARLSFSVTSAAIHHRYVATGAAASEPLPPREVKLCIAPLTLEHQVSFTLGVRLGRGVASMPAGTRPVPLGWQRSDTPLGGLVTSSTVRTAFAADVRFELLGSEAGSASWASGFLFDDLELAIPAADPAKPEDSPLLVGETALQFRWRTYGLEAGSRLQLLPGMHVATGNAPGFTALTFRVLTAPGDVPTLYLASSFTEALVRCQWGEFLQDSLSTTAPGLARVFGSSAGDLVFGYTGESREATWDERYLLNGFLEVKDLVSWPRAMAVDATRAQLTLPAARAAAALEHLRHTLRILFDQHSIPPGTLETSPGDLLFQLAAGKGWQFLAVVEHQLVEVLPGATFTSPTLQKDRRWVVVQEVRLLAPASLKAHLLAHEAEALRLQAPVGGTALMGDVAYGYLGSGMRGLLAKGTTPALDELPAGTLLVEASAVHWLKEIPVSAPAPTALQYLPSGTQLATLSRPEDYAPTDPRDPAWLLLQMPFLGRMQDQSRDVIEPPAAGAPTPALLQIDPVLNLHRRRSSPTALPPLVLALTAWTESAPTAVTFSNFDAAVGRTWARLDPRALEESWFYLQKPAHEPPPLGLQSVLAALPDTPARLGRPTTLGLLYDGRRRFYPPTVDPDGEFIWGDLTTNQPVWRPGHLHVLQAVSSMSPSNTPPYGWLVTGLQLAGGLLARAVTQPSATRHHAAASALPLVLAGTRVPSGLAVSPFLSLEFRPAPPSSETALRIVVAELLCLDAASGRLRPVASQSWELGDREAVRRYAASWARETHLRLSPESPVAVLRFRELSQNIGPSVTSKAVLVTTYEFGLVPGILQPRRLARRVFRLRSSVAQLRFRDGRFGGREIPTSVRAFEVAPPQTNGVQPLHLTTRPAAQTAEVTWPWGLSALRTSVQYTQGKEGVAGRVDDSGAEGLSLWWQSLQHGVQYRSALSGDPAAGLPPTFRAVAIRSLLPVLPDPPLPAVDAVGILKGTGPRLSRRQPVLPGALRTTLVGARPGVFLSMRHQLFRQSGIALAEDRPQTGKALVSGSIPVQHRAPRPIPLPPNRADVRDVALRPWASWFEPEVGLLARTAPADEAFFAAFGAEPSHRLQMKVMSPSRGEIRTDWDGFISVDVALDGPAARIEEWKLSLQIERGGRTLRYPVHEPATGGPGRYSFQLAEESAEAETLRAILQEMRAGEVLVVSALVTRVQGTEGFYQVLSFPFRLVDDKSLRLPLEPFFVLFEDPEYDRQLASPAKHAASLVKTLENDQAVLHSVALSTDRTEYNPDSQLALRYDWDDDTGAHTARLTIDLIDATGVSRPLLLRSGTSFLRLITLSHRALRQISLLDLYDGTEPVRLAGGEALSLKLSIAPGARGVIEPAFIVLTVDITTESVTPAPQAAYALIRRQVIEGQTQVECVRFAWSPPASRIELVCPDDLRTEVVRRRAVFLWTDTARALAATGYAVQKITLTGSTHFPVPDVLERIV